MKRLYSLFVCFLLLLAAVAEIGWIYSLKHAGSYHWDRHIHPFFYEQSDYVMGYAVGSYWAVSWGNGRITLRKQFFAETDRFAYDAPPGFPMDEFLDAQYKQRWSQSIDEEERALNHRGSGAAMADVCNPNTWWGRRGFGRESSVNLPPYDGPVWGPGVFSGSAGRLACTLPAWALVLMLIMLPVFRLIAVTRRRHRIPPGHCLRCGYDLRASSGRCPECGLDACHNL